MSSEGENKFASGLVSKLYLNSDLGDVTFIFKNTDDDEKVSAEKSILAAGSPVFHAMFFGPMKEKGVVEIVDSSPEAFKEFLQFFHLENVKLTMANMEEVAALADKYDMLGCFNNYVTSFVGKLSLDKICWGYQLAIISKNEALKQYCEMPICEYPNDIFNSSTFLHCNQTVLKHILLLDDLMCEESDIFEACFSWAKFACVQNGLDETDPRALKKQLGECFYLIRFNAMAPEIFVTLTVSYEKMFTRDELAHILYRSSDKFTSNKFSSYPRLFPEWDSNKVLPCKPGSASTTYYIQNPESVWFSANRPLLLGEFDCWPLRHGSYSVNLNFDITINEMNMNTVEGAEATEGAEPVERAEAKSSTKIIFKGTVQITGDKSMKVHLPRPIAVRPKKIYQIILEASTNSSGYHSACMQWPSEHKLNDKTILSFHQNRSKIECRGLVSCLHFNELVFTSSQN